MNPFLLRKVVYPAFRALKRDRVLRYLAEMHRIQGMDPQEIREFQWNKLKRLLRYAAEHVPYYRMRFREIGLTPEDVRSPDDLAVIPILRKRDVRASYDDMVSEIYPRRHLRAGSTSGSTGESLRFRIDRGSSEASRANIVRMNEWIGIRVGDRVAQLWTVPLEIPMMRRAVNLARNWFSNTMVLSHYSLDDETLRSYLKALWRFRPDLLIAYPSTLARFSEFVKAAGAKPFRPKAIVVSAETLYEWQRGMIEEAFGAPVYNHYGSMEFIGLARECTLRRGLHIACERVLIEAVPLEGLPPDEDIRELVVTDLDNYGMPFIRYAIDDVGTITAEQCECGLGLPRLETTIGRTFDIIRAPNGNYLGGSFWTVLLRKVKGVQQFQVIQEELGEVILALVPTDEFSEESRRQIAAKVSEACGPQMRIRFDLKRSLRKAPGGKHRFVVSKIGASDSGHARPSTG